MSAELPVRLQVQQQLEVAATRKEEKYADLDSRYLFKLIAVETLGVLNSSANSLLKEIGHKISLNTGESGGQLPTPAHFSSGATVQRYFVARLIADHRRRGLNIVLAIV